MKPRVLRCLLIIACTTMAVGGCGSHSTSPVTMAKSKIAAEANSGLALESDGSLWAWGYGALGLGKNLTRLRPTQVGVATDWAGVSCGHGFTLALKKDGTLWAWGWNGNGQLGLGDTNERVTPTQVGDLAAWASVSAGDSFTVAVEKNGTLWAWGWNGNGQRE